MSHPLKRLSSRQNPIVARVRALARRGAAGSADVVIEGTTLMIEADAARWPFDLIAVTDRALEQPELAALVERSAGRVDCFLVSPTVMDAMSPVSAPSGALAVARAPHHSADEVLARAGAGLVVCAVDVQDPGNLGAIVRVAEAAGATGVMACGASADPFSWKALRGAMGSAFRLPVVRRIAVDAAMACFSAAGWQQVASALRGECPDAIDFRRPTALFVGSEGSGLPAEVVAACATKVCVPMNAPVESLNVAVAAAVILYEARRQRTKGREDPQVR